MINRPPSIVPVPQAMPRPITRKPSVPELPDLSWEKLVQKVEELAGWNEMELRGYLDAMGYEFSPETYREIVTTLQMSVPRWREQAKIVTVWDRYYDTCPMCGGPTVPDPRRNRKFGAEYGWKCVENRFHFIDWRWKDSHAKA